MSAYDLIAIKFQDYGFHCAERIVNYIGHEAANQAIDAARQVSELALTILKGTALAALFFTNTSLFVIGGVVAIVIPDKMEEINTRICNVWGILKPRGKAVAVLIGFYGWPIVLAASSFFVGAQISLNLQQEV